MGRPGFVYILTNPSLQGAVKIGKTERDVATRASELSAATGIPTPFTVAYDAPFSDCDQAEEFVHAYLERLGTRVSANREFFNISLRDAVRAVVLAEQTLSGAGSGTHSDSDGVGADTRADAFFADADLDPPWQSSLDEATRLDLGWDDSLQDQEEAFRLYRQAARLGSAEAYLRLAAMCASGEGCRQDHAQAISWLKEGAQRGICECWAELGLIYQGRGFDFPPYFRHADNAQKSYRRFFESVDPASFPSADPRLYGLMRAYMALLPPSDLRSSSDAQILAAFVDRYVQILELQDTPNGAEAKERELRALLQPSERVASIPRSEPVAIAARRPWWRF